MVLKKLLWKVWLGSKEKEIGKKQEWLKSDWVKKRIDNGRTKVSNVIRWKWNEDREIEMPSHYMDEALWIKKEDEITIDPTASKITVDNDIKQALQAIQKKQVEIPRQNIRRNINAIIENLILKAKINYLWKNSEAIIIDISKAGMKILSNRDMVIDTEIDTNFNFTWIKCSPKWKIVGKNESKSRPWYFTYSIKFLDLHESKAKEIDNILAITKNVASNIKF